MCGLKIMSVDGIQFKTPETKDNQKFGYATNKTIFPSVLTVTLISTHTHIISDTIVKYLMHNS
ncbi:hypothetical protein ERW52_20410 [Aliivibrio finisterrensis]|uniref:Uncharacterized protein n=1 Tax=Aliivibrio finisterrensis TaxID=511998 RepID=A0A4Q5KZF2_9GAMM|nr:hypothetical protein ERW56_11175 [Aliivibrio finisterrensis]RYU53717.1 hypothetical protein ERW57_03980 [Aliivibrio finisterrensis]RYU57732.1 hypothetical protein ERW50_10585 [Aliivibrio finisterrensis]RYU58530.1 hypothetical protein ERW53_20420 [Aliivibrio finisterrensis]RYU78575.1 hypothetical protein ERW52_20410 [Aliivibrio finisterrensis]